MLLVCLFLFGLVFVVVGFILDHQSSVKAGEGNGSAAYRPRFYTSSYHLFREEFVMKMN